MKKAIFMAIWKSGKFGDFFRKEKNMVYKPRIINPSPENAPIFQVKDLVTSKTIFVQEHLGLEATGGPQPLASSNLWSKDSSRPSSSERPSPGSRVYLAIRHWWFTKSGQLTSWGNGSLFRHFFIGCISTGARFLNHQRYFLVPGKSLWPF